MSKSPHHCMQESRCLIDIELGFRIKEDGKKRIKISN